VPPLPSPVTTMGDFFCLLLPSFRQLRIQTSLPTRLCVSWDQAFSFSQCFP